MDTRISSRRDEIGIVVRIEGRLNAATVPDLLATCRAVGSPLRLDLSGLMSADADGAEALHRLAEAGRFQRSLGALVEFLVGPARVLVARLLRAAGAQQQRQCQRGQSDCGQWWEQGLRGVCRGQRAVRGWLLYRPRSR